MRLQSKKDLDSSRREFLRNRLMLKLLTLKPRQELTLFRPLRPKLSRLLSQNLLKIWRLPSMEDSLTLFLLSRRQEVNSRLSSMPDLLLGKSNMTLKKSMQNGNKILTIDFLS